MAFARAILVAIALTAAANAAERPNAHDALAAAFDSANKRKDCRTALTTVNTLLAMPAFAKGPMVDRADAYLLGTWCSLQLQDRDAARRFALAGTALEGASVDLWRMRLGIERDSDQPAAAVATVEALASAKPEVLASIPVRDLHALRRSLAALPDKAADRRLLAVLTRPDYVPDQGSTVADPFRSDYAAMLAADGDRAAAAALVARITEPTILIGVSVDPLLRDLLPPGFDGRDAAEARLAQAREVAASHAGSLYAVNDVSRYLRLLGRYDEALATLAAASPDAPGAAFSDLAQQRNWYWDETARIYQRLGRYADAVAAFRTGIEVKENGRLNVSQTINLGEAQIRFAHHEDALATIKAFDTGGYDTSPYGTMQLRLVRACARLALGQTVAAQEDIAFMAAHERDAPEALMSVHLCANNLDAAAAEVIRRLDDPDRRAEALLLLSDYDPPPAGYPPSPYYARLPDLKARADVQAAIKRAGGVRRFHLQREDL